MENFDFTSPVQRYRIGVRHLISSAGVVGLFITAALLLVIFFIAGPKFMDVGSIGQFAA